MKDANRLTSSGRRKKVVDGGMGVLPSKSLLLVMMVVCEWV
jgi:hypothetical protein